MKGQGFTPVLLLKPSWCIILRCIYETRYSKKYSTMHWPVVLADKYLAICCVVDRIHARCTPYIGLMRQVLPQMSGRLVGYG